MTEGFKIETCNKEDITTILTGINTYNWSKVSAVADLWTSLDYVIKTKNGEQVAGLLAGIGYWNGLEIKVLWVSESHRNQGLGSLILKHVEGIAREKGATIAMLDTFDFQAVDFYLKNGYEKAGLISNFPSGHQRIYFSKRLI